MHRNRFTEPLLLLALLLSADKAFSAEDPSRILQDEDDIIISGPIDAAIAPGERFSRAEAVFGHFFCPMEKAEPSSLDLFTDWQNLAGANRILPVLDPKKQFSRFFSMNASEVRSFLDRDQKKFLDYEVSLAAAGVPVRENGLLERFKRAAENNPRNFPLQGLKIAIDPGHMGGDVWDTRTGKFVKDKNGAKLSEGVLNLQTALLLEREFVRMGAEVAITHRRLAPVTSLRYEDLSLQEFGREELRNEGLAPWFESLLATAPAGPSLYKAFEQSSQFKKLFAEFNRGNYFILRADLAARWQAIEAFSPDITLIIHYDASGPGTVSPVPRDGTKVYVVGSFEPAEFATQKSRLRLAKHLVDPESWTSSLKLGRLVVGNLKTELGIGFDKGGGGSSFEVEPGIFARNLGVSAALSGHAVTYIEVLHYDDPSEFRMLRDYKYPMTIDGVSAPYSDRLVQVVNAIKRGVVGFVDSYATR